MSLHHSSNKPRSIHRQASAPHPTQYPNANNRQTLAPISSSLEHYVDQWLSRNSNSNNSSRRHSVSSEKSGDNGLNGIGNGLMTATATSPSIESSPNLQTQSTISFSSVSTPVLTEQGRKIPWSCPCCQLPDCDSWRKTTRTIQKLEMEIQLAAEIGQSLLQKNEDYMIESNELKNRLKQYHDRNDELVLSLDDSERLAKRLNREKDKWMWQYEKSEQILNESVADLETTNEKCAALTKDLEETKLEMEKLQLFKYKSHQSDTREDTLQSKLEDTKQELMISRKNELGLETKYKKLMARYEALSCSYQDLSKRSSVRNSNVKLVKPLSSISTPTAADIQQASTEELVTFIKELVSTNNALKTELLDTTTRLDDLTTLQEKQQLNQTQPDSIAKGQSPERSNTIGNNSDRITRRAREQKSSDEIKTATLKSRRHRSASARIPRTKSTRESTKPPTSRPSPPIPQATSSTPVVHHHYHYYLRQQQNEGTGELNTKGNNNDHDDMISRLCSDQNCNDPLSTNTPGMPLPPHLSPPNHATKNDLDDSTTKALGSTDSIQHHHHHQSCLDPDSNENISFTLSPSNSSIPAATKPNQTTHEDPSAAAAANESILAPLTNPTFENHHTPYTTLFEQATAILQRLRSTDARTLNRRLQRAFDIVELTNMSNAILQNVVTDVETMEARFLWLTPDENDEDDGTTKSISDQPSPCLASSLFSVDEFFPLLRLVQELLLEIGQLSITMNHLQVAYVKKIEENEVRVEQEILGKRQGQSSINNHNTPVTPSLLPSASTSTPLSSISSIDSLTSTTERPLDGANTIIHSPVNWLSGLFTGNSNSAIVQTSSSTDTPTDLATTVTRPAATATVTATTTTTVTDTSKGNRTLGNHQGPLYTNSGVKRPARKRTINSRIATHPRKQQLQQHSSNTHRFWPSLTLIMDEWSHLTQVKQSSSSSLDREWLWTCSDEGLPSTSPWLKDRN